MNPAAPPSDSPLAAEGLYGSEWRGANSASARRGSSITGCTNQAGSAGRQLLPETQATPSHSLPHDSPRHTVLALKLADRHAVTMVMPNRRIPLGLRASAA